MIANYIDPYPQRGGFLGSIVLGILGAVLGGLLGDIVFGLGVSRFSLPSMAIAVLGSLLLLFISRASQRS